MPLDPDLHSSYHYLGYIYSSTLIDFQFVPSRFMDSSTLLTASEQWVQSGATGRTPWNGSADHSSLQSKAVATPMQVLTDAPSNSPNLTRSNHFTVFKKPWIFETVVISRRLGRKLMDVSPQASAGREKHTNLCLRSGLGLRLSKEGRNASPIVQKTHCPPLGSSLSS